RGPGIGPDRGDPRPVHLDPRPVEQAVFQDDGATVEVERPHRFSHLSGVVAPSLTAQELPAATSGNLSEVTLPGNFSDLNITPTSRSTTSLTAPRDRFVRAVSSCSRSEFATPPLLRTPTPRQKGQQVSQPDRLPPGAQAVYARTRNMPASQGSVVNGNSGTTSFFVTANDVVIDGTRLGQVLP